MDRVDTLRDWIAQLEGGGRAWFAKRLSANDSGQTGGHQVGFYVPAALALHVAPELGRPVLNPRRQLEFSLLSHDQQAAPNLIYYNSRRVRGQANGRDEFRVTGFGGRRSALQDPDNTGALLVTAWRAADGVVEAWLTSGTDEEDAVEAALGAVEPAVQVLRLPGAAATVEAALPGACDPDMDQLPPAWRAAFPAGRELTEEAVRRRPGVGETIDQRVVSRFRCEYGLFRVVESAHTLPLVTGGFASVDDFLTVAQAVANRRKARAGRSLELHLALGFEEEGLAFERGRATEGGRTPDFVFPSIAAYHAGLPTHMLGVKTTVKDRWRQVLDEAALIPEKHLFTLAEGVSVQQFEQMTGAGIRLVVPRSHVSKFPEGVRARLMTLTDFVALVRRP